MTGTLRWATPWWSLRLDVLWLRTSSATAEDIARRQHRPCQRHITETLLQSSFHTITTSPPSELYINTPTYSLLLIFLSDLRSLFGRPQVLGGGQCSRTALYRSTDSYLCRLLRIQTCIWPSLHSFNSIFRSMSYQITRLDSFQIVARLSFTLKRSNTFYTRTITNSFAF